MDIKKLIRDVPDYPKKGINFKDITSLLQNPDGFQFVIDHLFQRYSKSNLTQIVGIESRGFIFGAALAYKLNIGFVPIRKKGKLPCKTHKIEYELEYGSDCIEIHIDSLDKNDKVLILDDLIATGGTAIAAIDLVEKTNAKIVESCFIVDLFFLGGSNKILDKNFKSYSICTY